MDIVQRGNEYLFYIAGKEVGSIRCSGESMKSIDHVIVKKEFEGQGHASTMMKEIVTHFKNEKIAFVCVCTYACAWMKKHEKI